MKTIALDFDGVLHSYSSAWQGADVVADPPVPGAQDFVRGLLATGWEPVICSTRAAHDLGRGAIIRWLESNGFPEVRVAAGKPSALVYLDDRALRFDGRWPAISEIETAAKPWNKP